MIQINICGDSIPHSPSTEPTISEWTSATLLVSTKMEVAVYLVPRSAFMHVGICYLSTEGIAAGLERHHTESLHLHYLGTSTCYKQA